ncbi:MAG: DUF45 domain-containing protein [Clostridia bacterium]|nr:DUF45 domain-containing protein [Clostridia bacterium]
MLIDNVSIIRQKRKSLKIIINSNAELIVYSPLKLSIEKINSILEEKSLILNKKLAQIRLKKQKYINIYEYKTLFLLGKEYYIIRKLSARQYICCYSSAGRAHPW